MEEQWNNVELSDLSRKSYTLNHEYDKATKTVNTIGNNNNNNVNNTDSMIVKQDTTNGNSTESDVLQAGSDIKPKIKIEDVEVLLRRLYGITIGEYKEFISYDDRNYFIKEDTNIKNPLLTEHSLDGYIFKVLNSLDSKKTDFIEAQNELLLYLAKEDIKCPKPIANVSGKYYSVEQISGVAHIVRLLTFIPGKILYDVPMTNYLLFQSGEYLAKIDRALKKFTHEAYDTHKTLWMLQSIPQLRDFKYALKDPVRELLVEDIITAFEQNVLCHLDKLETQIIHGDYNEHNILVESYADTYRVAGIIDFGDTSRSPLIFEVGVAMTYMMLQAKCLESAGVFFAGYNSVNPLRAKERSYLKYCVAARLAQSLTMGAYTYAQDPSNEYVLVTQEQGWKLIEELWQKSFKEIDEIWQNAADQYLTQSDK